MNAPQPEGGTDWVSLGDSLLLRIIHLGVVAGKEAAEKLSSYELSPAEVSILWACRDYPGCTAVMISQVVPIDTPSISRNVHRLVGRGLLARRRSSHDRREVRLRLSSEGEHILNALLLLLSEAERQVLQVLDEEQVRTFQLYTDALFAANFLRAESEWTDGDDG